MKRVLGSKQMWIGAAVMSAFLPLLLLPRAHLFDFVNALTVATGIGVIAAYGPGIWKSFREREWSGSHYLVLGITATWVATTARHVWSWVWRYLGKPVDMTDSPFLAFLVWIAFMGGILHLAAKGAIKGGVPKENWIRVGIALALGLALFFVVAVILDPSVPLSEVVD